MKIPKSFTPKKDLEGKTEELLKKKGYDVRVVCDLLNRCDEFLKQKSAFNLFNMPVMYDTAIGLAKDFNYTLNEVEALTKRLITKNELENTLGIYISVLINRVIRENDIVTLELKSELSCLGSYLNKGTLIVQGNTGFGTGHYLDGGKIIVGGDTGNYAGRAMRSGELIIKGDAGVETGCGMLGGKLIVEGHSEKNTGRLMKNGKLIVHGNAGDHTGYDMKSGLIRVLGNSGHSTGNRMGGGKIIVGGDVGHSLGFWMEGGDIIVHGDAEKYLGTGMLDGNIRIYGKMGLVNKSCTGNIYHGDSMVWPKHPILKKVRDYIRDVFAI